jgi:predicted NBD/HSP70 family sugar kinase
LTSSSRTLAFDVGGTRLKWAVVRPASQGWDVGPPTIVSSATPLDDVRTAIAAGRGEVDAVALCAPGIIDDGVVVSLPGKLAGLEGTDLRAVLIDAFGDHEPVVVNDAFAYACGVAGAGRTVAVTIGTGVGVGVIDEEWAGSPGPFDGGILGGQIPIGDGVVGETDTSGRTDTIEALCRAQRIVDCANRAGARFVDVASVYRDGGDLDEYRSRLVRALVALAHAHGPDVIVVGGGAMPPESPLFDDLEGAVNAELFGGFHVAVRSAVNPHTAALVGLARLTECR